MNQIGFILFLMFTVSWFTHLAMRIPALGAIRFDLLLVIVIAIIHFMSEDKKDNSQNPCYKKLITLIVFIIAVTPFAEWPGSVLRFGMPNFLKALMFFFFSIWYIKTIDRMRMFVLVFVLCQSFRVLEPLYLHVTQGYWGSFASMANWEFMERLSGAPNDVVNPNGLAYIILTITPFYFFLSKVSITNKIAAIILIPLFIYTLLLTGSRSGLVGLVIIFGGILFKSKSKALLVLLFCVCILFSINYMSSNFKDRYESIYSSDTKNASTAEGRIEGTKKSFIVALRKPLFGHGLGTSREANANYGPGDQPAHNLYAEIAQELGFIGLAIFVMFIKSIVINHSEFKEIVREETVGSNYLMLLNDSMQVWLLMTIMFSFASYGLSSYEWYLFAGLSVAIRNVYTFQSRVVKMPSTST